MSDDESRTENLPTEGDAIFTENGSETVEHGQTGLPPWAAAVTAQLQKVFTAQLEDHLAAQAQAHRAELQELIEECRASARTARMATAQWQDQQEMHEARQERTSHEASEVSPQTAEQASWAIFQNLSPSAMYFGFGHPGMFQKSIFRSLHARRPTQMNAKGFKKQSGT